MAFSENYQQPVTQQGSIGVEYEVWKDLAISATYLRTKGTHLQHWQDVNLLEPQPATILFGDSGAVVPYRLYPKSRPIVGFDRVLLLNSNASTSYNGLAIQANKRFSQNFQFLLAYTFGKIIDDAPTLGSVNPGSGAGGDASFLSDSLDPRLDRGPGDFDQRHKLVVGGVWDLEYGRRLSRPAKTILNGWELSGILSAAAGTAYSGLLNIDLNNDGNAATDRAPGVGRNSFHLPSTVTFDPRVSRRVDFTERVHLQVSVDAFNVFNRANISGVQTTQFTRSACGGVACLLPQESFGTPTEALNPRIIQLSTKIVF